MNFNVYKASAGSGKTYTLVKEYIKKLLSNKTPRAHSYLLAITFTNKASAEMKSRIISTLAAFSTYKTEINNSYTSIYKNLKFELKYSDQELISASKKALSDIIHNYSFFSVSTIDKFIYKIIKGFSYELELPANFEVEMDKDKLIEEGVLALLDEVGLDDKLTNILLEYSNYKTNQDKHWDIQDDLFQVSKELFKDQKFIFINQLMDFKLISLRQKELTQKIYRFEKSIISYKRSIEKVIKGISPSSFLYQALPNYLKKLNHKPYDDIEISSISNKRIFNSIQGNNWAKKTASSSDKQKINSISHILNTSLTQLTSFLSVHYSEYRFNKKCYSSLFLVSVLGRIDEKIEIVKAEKNIVHISEFNQIIFRFLNKNSVPFIFEKIGNRYQHYFIDEFQDTSIFQWKNLLPLVEETLSKGGSCLIVGDGKQSIYRWRGGEVNQFLNLCDSKQVNVKSLDTNYRSSKEIVQFNNEFFSFLSTNLTVNYSRLYHQLSQKTSKTSAGFIDISLLDFKSKQLDLETLKLIGVKIKNVIDDGYSFSDIAILARNNREIIKVATYLTENGIPIISSESLLLRQSPTIQFLLNALRILTNETDYFAKANFLEYLIANKLIETKSVSHHKFIADNAQKNNIEIKDLLITFGINFNLEKLKNVNIYEIVERLIRAFNLHQCNNLYINFFLDFVFEYSMQHTSSINGFIDFWNQKKDVASILIPEGINAIQMLSIHKSKGLQFPVVIFPFANWKDDLGKDKKWFNVSNFFANQDSNNQVVTLLPLTKEIELWPPPFPLEYAQHKELILLDNINLLYVAMTRPQDRLYIISNLDNRRGNIYKYYIDFLNQYKSHKFQNNTFSCGKRLKKHSEITSLKNIELNQFVSEEWRHRIRIKKNHIINKNIKQKYSIIWGDLIHDIMAQIKTADDIDIILKKLYIEKKYTKDVCKTIHQQISTIVNHTTISHLFQDGMSVFSETSILTEGGKVFRPDRVVVHKDNTASLVDYKTGNEHNSHSHQMYQYEEVLIKLGFKRVNKYIVYLNNGIIKKIN